MHIFVHTNLKNADLSCWLWCLAEMSPAWFIHAIPKRTENESHEYSETIKGEAHI